jgi:hypothetical protein
MEFGNLMALVYLEESVLLWKRVSLVGECFLPGFWLAFSLDFAKKEPWFRLREWKLAFGGVLAASVLFSGLVVGGFFARLGDSAGLLVLDGFGKVFYVFFLLGVIVVGANLEHTVRQATGDQRASIRFFVLGVGGLLAFLIYGASQHLLFSRISLGMIPVSSSVFLICALVMAYSLVRHRLMDVNLYVSRSVVYNTVTVFVAGAYLVFVGVVGQVVSSFDLISGFPLEVLFLFVAILILLGLFLSDRVRWKTRMWINRHFYRSRYDYRKEWLKFSEGLSLKLTMGELISPIVEMVKDTVGAQTASVWLWEADDGVFKRVRGDRSDARDQLIVGHGFFQDLKEWKTPFTRETPWGRGFFEENRKLLAREKASLVVPMVSGQELIGVILVGGKVTGERFLADDIDLLHSAGAQIASAILNTRLSEALIETREMEMFHRFSSFVLHDLKNLVATLSLVVENAEKHMSDPEFQQDALKTIGRSVDKMEALMGKLSSQTGKPQLHPVETDLNTIVSDVAARAVQDGRNGRAAVQTDLRDIPSVLADPEEIKRVVENLLFNAFQALDGGGDVRVRTEADRGRVVLTVSDSGRGMPQEFVERSLFRPFTSTKKKGLGIGLYHCKTIVEAHGGSIEVESEVGKGSTFRVGLPVPGRTGDRRWGTG